MANASTEEVLISTDELARLRRDSKILDVLEADKRGVRPDLPPYRRLIGGLVDAEDSVEAIMAGETRRREARRAAGRRPDPSRGLSRVS